ncbi:hypothetical protein [Streptomyces sp. NBC_00094]|uniref:hypothetical protein n=1 Tax=Streptomyces sp. NBC_00094 TaxID=2903620 RepID=UPI00225A44FA|nr:hypothetical protein [Streptomyces sp. NBC_00094]MCX5390101.1 hypothetical protein [Streptomyces sp. NBC_00094]
MSAAARYQVVNRPVTSPVTTFLWESRGEGRVEARGECPECRCVTTRIWEDVQYVTKGPVIPGKPALDDGEPKYARCACPTWHVDRPAGVEKGCGASFWLAPPPQGLPL